MTSETLTCSSAATQQRVHVVASLGLLGHRLDAGIGDQGAVLVLSMVHVCSRLPFGKNGR